MDKVPVPVVAGVKVTLMVQFVPGAKRCSTGGFVRIVPANRDPIAVKGHCARTAVGQGHGLSATGRVYRLSAEVKAIFGQREGTVPDGECDGIDFAPAGR